MIGAISNVEWIKHEGFATLFQAEKELRDEINKRAWEYLRTVGYDWYAVKSISVIMFKRGKVDIIEIKANVEQNYKDIEIKSEVELKIFEMTLRRDTASEGK
jgi:hypothetical protein